MDKPAPRGRPRDELLTRAILDAAVELLASEGLGAVSLEAVARRAGVSRPSIYKRWSTLSSLLLDAALDARQGALSVGAREAGFPAPDTGSLAGDLKALVEAGVALFANLERGGVIQVLFAEAIRSEEVARRLEDTILAPDENLLRAIFRRAAERGEWPAVAPDSPDEDAMLVLRSLIAHSMFERYVLHRPFDEIRTGRLAELLAHGAKPDRP